MAYLAAQGSDPEDGWRRTLPTRPVTLGRVPGDAVEWAAPWDRQISSLHAVLTWDGQRLTVRRSPKGRNPIFFQGCRRDEFMVEVGDSFAIGKTIFTLEEDAAPLGGFGFGSDAGHRADLLARGTPPGQVHRRRRPRRGAGGPAGPDPAVARRRGAGEAVLDVLLRGIARAGAAAVVRLQDPEAARAGSAARAARFPGLEKVPPSRRLVADALRRRQSVLYRWDRKDLRPDITMNAAFDWALSRRCPKPRRPAGACTWPDVCTACRQARAARRTRTC